MVANESNLSSSFLKSTLFSMELPVKQHSSTVRLCSTKHRTPTSHLPHRTYYPIRDFTESCTNLPSPSSSFPFNKLNMKEFNNYGYELNDGLCNSHLYGKDSSRSAFKTWCHPSRSFQRQKVDHEPYGSCCKRGVVNDREEILFAFQNRTVRDELASSNYDNCYTCSPPRRILYSDSLPSRLSVAEKSWKETTNIADYECEHLRMSSLSISLRRNRNLSNCQSMTNSNIGNRRCLVRNNDVVNTDNDSRFSRFNVFSGTDYSSSLKRHDDDSTLGRISPSLRCQQQRPESCDCWHLENGVVADACYFAYTPRALYRYNTLTVSNSMNKSAEKHLDKPKMIVSEARVKIGFDKNVNSAAADIETNQARVKPPLPLNPPSQSRILRYSHSVNGLRKQKLAVPLAHPPINSIIDAFQEDELKKSEPRARSRVAGPGGYGPPGRTGITAAGTGANVSSQVAVSSSSKKKKSKKEKKSKLRKADISNPTNFTHKAHIGWDASGGFSQETYDNELMDNSVRDLLRAAGENPDRMTKDEIDFTYRFLHQYQKSGAAPATPARKGQKPSGKQRPPPPQQPAGTRPPEGPPAPPSAAEPEPQAPASNLPPVCASAPPPPPPPPVVARPPPAAAAEESSEGGDLLSQIRSGASLKSASESAPAAPKPASRDDVLAQIRQGKVLKTVDKAALEQKKEANLEDIGGIAGALAKALKDIREKVHDSEESSEEDDENNDDEWASD